MSRVLVWSDLHLHPHKKSYDRLQHCLDVLEWVFETAKNRGITDIVFCGDLYHDRQKIDIFVYQRTYEIMRKYLTGETSFYCLLGNHDLWHTEKWDVNSVIPLGSLPGFRLIDTVASFPIQGTVFDFLPFTHDPFAHLGKLATDRGNRVLCAHLAVNGAVLNTMHNTRADVNVEHDSGTVAVDVAAFTDWKQVFLGHYHGEQKLAPNVEYVGSPLQLSFGEAFQFKHIIVYDPATNEKEYVRNTFSPQHLIIPAKDVHKYDLANNFVRVLVDDLTSTDIVDMRTAIMAENGPGSLEIKPVDREERNHVIENATAILFKETEMLERYVDEAGTEGLDRQKLLEVGKLICSPITPEELEALS